MHLGKGIGVGEVPRKESAALRTWPGQHAWCPNLGNLTSLVSEDTGTENMARAARMVSKPRESDVTGE